jgi:predicted  nucleic acid-binding Zn-ribbon protein
MLTDEDITKIVSVVATKEDIRDLRQDMNGLRESIQSLVISVDKLVKVTDDLKTEYVVINNQVSRHEKWFHQIADKLDIKLEY